MDAENQIELEYNYREGRVRGSVRGKIAVIWFLMAVSSLALLGGVYWVMNA